jgi:hypothetical protein
MKPTTKVSVKVVGIALATMAAAGALIWYFFLRKRVIEVNASVTVPEDEIVTTYVPTPASGVMP